MEIAYLKDFIAIAGLGSFTGAAEERNISQSAISKHMDALEREVGGELFEGTARQRRMTERGKILLQYAEQLCRMESALFAELAELDARMQNRISVLISPGEISPEMLNVLDMFRKEHRECVLHIREMEFRSRDSRYDSFSIYTQTLDISGKNRELLNELTEGEYLVLADDSFVVLFPETWDLPDDETITFEAYLQYPRVSFHKSVHQSLYKVSEDYIRENGLQENIVYYTNWVENAVTMVKRGMGVTMISARSFRSYGGDKRGIKVKRLLSPLRARLVMQRISGRAMTPAEKEFWEFMASEFTGISE